MLFHAKIRFAKWTSNHICLRDNAVLLSAWYSSLLILKSVLLKPKLKKKKWKNTSFFHAQSQMSNFAWWHNSLSFICSCYFWDSLLVERQTCDTKVASLNPGRSGGKIFFSRVYFVCWLLFSVRSTPVLLQWLSLIHIWRCRRDVLCRSRWSPYH